MATFTGSDDLKGAEFRAANLTGARFVECDLTDVVVRGSEVARMDIDAPWLVHGDYLRVNGVDVTAYVEGELDARFPGRADRRAADPDGLRAAWAAVERAWDAALARAAAMPAGSVDVSVDGEWSFAQTLRHLVHATDVWLGKAVLEVDEPFHPLGLGYSLDGVAAEEAVPPYDEVLEARAGRVAMVRELLAIRHRRGPGRDAQEPAQPRAPRDHPLLPARDPRGDVGAPPLRRPGPRHDRG